LPIDIRWIIEGEEEVGSPHFGAIAKEYADLLKADGARQPILLGQWRPRAQRTRPAQ
jgi:hypothetical protein